MLNTTILLCKGNFTHGRAANPAEGSDHSVYETKAVADMQWCCYKGRLQVGAGDVNNIFCRMGIVVTVKHYQCFSPNIHSEWSAMVTCLHVFACWAI